MKTYKLILADDEYIVRKGIAKMIDWAGLSLELIGECANGREVIETIRHCGEADILLTDALMPGMDGLALANWMHKNCPACDVLFFSGHAEYDLLREAMRSHAVDYLLKPVERNALNRVLAALVEKRDRQQSQVCDQDRSVLMKMLLNYAQGRIPFDSCMDAVSGPIAVLLAECQAENHSMAEWFSGLFSGGLPAGSDADGRLVLLGGVPDQNTERLCHELAGRIQSGGAVGFRAGLSRSVASIRELPRAYLQAKKALTDCFGVGQPVVVYADDYQNTVVIDIMEYIEFHYQQPLSLQAVSKRFAYNPSYVSRVFKAHTGQSFTKYLAAKRIGKATELLSQRPDCRITDLAEAVGIPDLNYFCKVFKRETGKTPYQYKKMDHDAE